MSRSLRRRALVTLVSSSAIALISAAGCKKKDDEPYLFGPDQDGDGWPHELDCDDHDETIFPAADDIPGDGIDQDCSGSDAREVGFGGMGGMISEPPGDGDGDFVGDGDGDGATGGVPGVGGSPIVRGVDADGDGFAAFPEGEDCDDDRLAIYPGAPEIPLNGVDENCDGSDLVGGEQLIFPTVDDADPFEPPDVARSVIDGEEHFLLVWSDSRLAPGQQLLGQLVDAAGEPLGDEIEIEVDDLDQKTDVRVASKGDAFLVAWVTVNGISVRQLNADGTPSGIALGYGPAGSVEPSVAYSNGHWAVSWRDGGTQEAWIRAMTVEGARGDVLELGDGGINSVSLTGRGDGFVVTWQGPGAVEPGAIYMQERSLTGYEVDPAENIVEGAYATPRVAWDGERTLLTFTVAGSFNYLAGLTFDGALEAHQNEPFRLSSETVFLAETRTTALGTGFFSVWNDGRHFSHVPSAQAIYGNGLSFEGNAALVMFSGARAQLVDSSVGLGGVCARQDGAVLSADFNGRPALLMID